MLPPVLYPKIEDVVQVDIREQRRNHRALRRPLFRLRPLSILENPGSQPFLDQAENPSIPDAMLEKRNHPGVAKRPNAIPNVSIQTPIHLLPYDRAVERI